MFIRKQSAGGYDRHGQQRSGRGEYLILFSWNDYRALDEIKAVCPACWEARDARQSAIADEHWPAYTWREDCPEHSGQIKSGLEIPRYTNGKPMLWATVRSCALNQYGHWMMGTVRIGGKSITVSGSCGFDGLPMDYQAVPKGSRGELVQVPEDVAAVYWADDGHNTIGKAAPTVREWALQTFKGRR